MLVASDDPLVRYEGRVAHGPLGASFDWPLTAVSIRFRCDGPGAVSALLDGAANRFSVTLTTDDHMDPPVKQRSVFTAAKSGAASRLALADVPGRGVYTLRLCKLTEPSHSGVPSLGLGLGQLLGMQGVVCFKAWELPSGSEVVPLPRRPARRMEMIGGSDTCGFGADTTSSAPTPLALLRNELHNAELSHSAELARRLGAELHVEAWSGKGVVNNAFQGCGLFGTLPMPALLSRTLATRAEPFWDFAWQPHLVVVDVGGNDYNNCFPTPDDAFVQAYVEMLKLLRQKYPHAVLLNICGGSTPSDQRRNKAATRVERSVQHFADERAVFVEVPVGVVSDEDAPGHFGHHSVVGHKKISDFLEPVIREQMGWF